MSILQVNDLKKHYALKTGFSSHQSVKALDGVTFSVEEGTTLGIVGESGCGKSTLAKVLLGLEKPTAGEILFHGKAATGLPVRERQQTLQMIFQDPYSSLNPRKKAWQIISEPLAINSNKSRLDLHDEAVKMMEVVGLRRNMADRYPHMFSGGQRQRLGIARALMLHPKILICDEPVSALDVSIQAQVLNLLMDLQDEFKLTYLFISHDLGVVRHLSDYLLVMYLGKIVEFGPRQEVMEAPKHPYTKALLKSSPSLKGERGTTPALTGELPSPLNPPSGCSFHKRCPIAISECAQRTPSTKALGKSLVACDLV
jgi:dipeptide transport system ATP-binding protein